MRRVFFGAIQPRTIPGGALLVDEGNSVLALQLGAIFRAGGRGDSALPGVYAVGHFSEQSSSPMTVQLGLMFVTANARQSTVLPGLFKGS